MATSSHFFWLLVAIFQKNIGQVKIKKCFFKQNFVRLQNSKTCAYH
jgi:hypothetical protein